MTLYLDGASVATGSRTGDITTTAYAIGAFGTTGTFPFTGRIDEVRISNAAHSFEWIKTEYRNQCACEDFLTIGNTETQPDSATPTTITKASATALTLSSPLIQAINSLYRTAYNRGSTFQEWTYWADRIIAKEKTTFPELLGAMQWQAG